MTKPKKFENISQLTKEQLDKINNFLGASRGFSPFGDDALEMYTTENPLITKVIECVRFTVGKFVESKLKYLNVNGENYDDLVDEYKKTLNADDYSDDDYEKLIKKFRNQKKAETIEYAIVLRTTKFTDVDLLLLNKNLEPLGYRTEHFH